jgi:Icc-related predicted phosphoesterase
MTRIAAVGDVHLGRDSAPRFIPHFADIASRADLLLVAGDLTQHGYVDEARAFAEVVSGIGIPVVTVLGNHDYHQDAEGEIRRLLENAGICVLEKESTVLDVGGTRVGIAAAKGFGGGFGSSSGAEFGEREMKLFIHTAKEAADALYEHLSSLRCDVRIALMHYSPSRDTLLGEKLELYPFLGSYLLGEAIDRAGCDLALHGHAHHGAERGLTAGGIPVRNVAMPVIRTAYNTYEFAAAAREQPQAAASSGTRG